MRALRDASLRSGRVQRHPNDPQLPSLKRIQDSRMGSQHTIRAPNKCRETHPEPSYRVGNTSGIHNKARRVRDIWKGPEGPNSDPNVSYVRSGTRSLLGFGPARLQGAHGFRIRGCPPASTPILIRRVMPPSSNTAVKCGESTAVCLYTWGGITLRVGIGVPPLADIPGYEIFVPPFSRDYQRTREV
jgi:hypothetical protein